jgi:hypothetical protein
MYSLISPSESFSGLTIELTMGNSSMASDNALMKKGRIVSPSM